MEFFSWVKFWKQGNAINENFCCIWCVINTQITRNKGLQWRHCRTVADHLRIYIMIWTQLVTFVLCTSQLIFMELNVTLGLQHRTCSGSLHRVLLGDCFTSSICEHTVKLGNLSLRCPLALFCWTLWNETCSGSLHLMWHLQINSPSHTYWIIQAEVKNIPLPLKVENLSNHLHSWVTVMICTPEWLLWFALLSDCYAVLIGLDLPAAHQTAYLVPQNLLDNVQNFSGLREDKGAMAVLPEMVHQGDEDAHLASLPNQHRVIKGLDFGGSTFQGAW